MAGGLGAATLGEPRRRFGAAFFSAHELLTPTSSFLGKRPDFADVTAPSSSESRAAGPIEYPTWGYLLLSGSPVQPSERF